MPDPERRPFTAPALAQRLLATALLAAAAGAQAASFDCKAARTPTEKAICGSPRLSALDDALARDYERALKALSAAGGASLKASQRSWLRYATQVCTPRGPAGEGERRADCLAAEFDRRRAQLAQAGVRVGPWVFNRVDAYASAPAPDGDGGVHSHYVTQHVAFPQIDVPDTPATRAWNAAQRKDAPGEIAAPTAPDDVAEDDDSDYTLGCAGERFISVRSDNSQYQHGAAHGSDDHVVSNLRLVPSLRPLSADDFFAPGSPWKARLPGLFWDTYRHQADAATDVDSIERAIRESAVNPAGWLATPDGLQISFDAGEAGCTACNPGPITLPWSALEPLRVAPELAACKAPPAAKR